jgi:hypothetical protein
MKYLALAVLLAIMQAATPAPRKAANPQAGATQNVAKQSSGDKTPAQQAPSIVQSVSAQPNQNTSHSPASENAPQPIIVRELPPVSVTKNWLDKTYIFLTAILALVGIFGVRAAYRTLRAIEQQAGEMKAQRETMQQQLTTMQGQLSQMEKAGEQTDSLIKQTTIAAAAAKDSAGEAKRGVDVAISKERARVRVEFEDLQIGDIGHGRGIWVAIVTVKVFNFGAVKAWPSDTQTALFLSASKEPQAGNSARPLIDKSVIHSDETIDAMFQSLSAVGPETIKAVNEEETFVHLHGAIRYADVFGEYVTPFHYIWQADNGYATATGEALGRKIDINKTLYGAWKPHGDNTAT